MSQRCQIRAVTPEMASPRKSSGDMAKGGYKVLLKHPHRPTEPGQWFAVPYSVVIDQPNLSAIANGLLVAVLRQHRWKNDPHVALLHSGAGGMILTEQTLTPISQWKSMAEQVSDPKLTTLDVKPLGPSAAREIGTFSLKTKGPTPQEVSGKYVVVWEKVGNDWKLATDIWNDGK
jgi:hypothetical protein